MNPLTFNRANPGDNVVPGGDNYNRLVSYLEYICRLKAAPPLFIADNIDGPMIQFVGDAGSNLIKLTGNAGGSGEYTIVNLDGAAHPPDGTAESMPLDGQTVPVSALTYRLYNTMEDANTTPDMTGHGLAPDTFHVAKFIGNTSDANGIPLYTTRAGTYVVSQDESSYRRVRERFRYGQGLTIVDDPDDPYRALIASYIVVGYNNCDVAESGASAVQRIDFFRDDFNLYLPSYDASGETVAVDWKGYDVQTSVYSGGGAGAFPAPNSNYVGDSKILNFFNAGTAQPAGYTRIQCKVGLDTVSTAIRQSPSVCGANEVIEAIVSIWADLPPQTWISVNKCGGTLVGAAGQTQIIQFNNGFSVAADGAVANQVDVDLNIAGDNWILVADSGTTCGGKVISHKDPNAVVNTDYGVVVSVSGNTLTLTPNGTGFDAKGHRVSSAGGTPTAYTPTFSTSGYTGTRTFMTDLTSSGGVITKNYITITYSNGLDTGTSSTSTAVLTC